MSASEDATEQVSLALPVFLGRRVKRQTTHSPAQAPRPHVPGFPEIDSRLEGFCLPAMPWLGIRADLHEANAHTDPRALGLARIALYHELAHRSQGRTPLFALYRRLIEHLWQSIEDIPINVRSHSSNPVLARLTTALTVPIGTGQLGDTRLTPSWSAVIKLHKVLTTYSEAVAVWSSLQYQIIHQDLGTENVARRESAMIQRYERVYPGFTVIYNLLKQNEVYFGTGIVTYMSIIPFCTLDLTSTAITLFENLKRMDKREIYSLWLQYDRDKNIEKFYQAFVGTPSVSSQQKEGFLKLRVIYYKLFGKDMSLPTSEEYYSYSDTFEVPFSAYNDREINLSMSYKPDEITSAKPMNEMWKEISKPQSRIFFFESIRQQLCYGNGLVCPFWKFNTCCGSRDKLEGIFVRGISRDNSVPWERRGCLRFKVS